MSLLTSCEKISGPIRRSTLLSPVIGLFAVAVFHVGVADTTALTQSELLQLEAICNADAFHTFSNTSKKRILLFHRDGYIPSIHNQLPDSVRADDPDSAAVLLCIEDDIEVIETCDINILFSVDRQRYRFRVEAVSLDTSGNRENGLIINGSAPNTCDDIGDIDNTITSIIGDPVSTNDLLSFLESSLLDREDNDRDGLRNLEEFRIGSDPLDPDSPPALAAVRVNGLSAAELYAGDTAEIRLDLYPASFIGNTADYYFWADMPGGRYVFQYPSGFLLTDDITPALSAPLIRIMNARLLRLRNLEAGDYRFYFEARDAEGSIDTGSASLTVIDDTCRELLALPLSVEDSWDASCLSTRYSDDGLAARYYSFTLSSQSALTLALRSELDAELILRDGKGRDGLIMDKSDLIDGEEILSTELDAGSYTVEVVRHDSANNESFELASSSVLLPWQFTDVTQAAGINHVHGYLASDIDKTDPSYERILQGAGVAAADFDQDGWVDMYVTGGSHRPNLLYRNLGDGTFEDIAEAAGVAFDGRKDTGATAADIDGDGWPDLFLGGVNGTPPLLLLNNQDGSFRDVTTASGLADIRNAYSAAFADYDRDGDLDVYIAHWNTSSQQKYLFSNDGSGVFTDVSTQAGIPDGLMADYTPHFSDINNDGWLDLLVAADFNTSQIYLNNKDGSFSIITDNNVVTDDNGMGAAVGDLDNDGDIDWFISSIFDPNGIPSDAVPGASTGATGNRLYLNDGEGNFSDVTDNSGVRLGGWGWGSCFADLDNDGFLDIFHVNGYVTGAFNNNSQFLTDGSRIFLNNGDGTFRNGEEELGFQDRGQGRGIACFDYDLDGDVDLFIANNQQAPSLYRNDGGNDNSFLHVRLGGEDSNSESVGARIYLTAGQMTQMREVYAGNNYISSNPADAYFGLGANESVDTLRIVWPSGEEKTLRNIEANQMQTIFK